MRGGRYWNLKTLAADSLVFLPGRTGHEKLAIAILVRAVADYHCADAAAALTAAEFLAGPWGAFLWSALGWPRSPRQVLDQP